jgi:hypothetical protein
MKLVDGDNADSQWHGLYKIGGVAALICAAVYLIAGGINAQAYNAGPFPSDVPAWFTLFQDNWLAGLVFLGFADVIIALVSIPLFLSLYAALSRANKTSTMIAISLAAIGIAVYLATNTAFSMLSLSDQYAAATTETQQSLLLAAGQSILATVEGTGARYIGLPLLWIAGIIMSVVMLHSETFSKITAYAGIVGFSLLLTSVPIVSYITIDPKTTVESAIVAVSYAGGGLLSLAWYILVARKLLQLGRGLPQTVESR